MTSVRWDKGHQLYYDGHQRRILNVIGPDVVHYVLKAESLNATTVDPSGMTPTVVEVGAGTTEFDVSDSEGLIGTITTAANENDGGQYQILGEQYVFDADHGLYLGGRVNVSDATDSDLLLGLCITDTTLLAGMTDGVYLECLDGSTDIAIVAEKDSTETTGTTVGTLADATLSYWEFYWDGTSLEAFVDGVSIYLATPANIPDDEALRPSIAFLNGAAGAETCAFARFECFQWGRS